MMTGSVAHRRPLMPVTFHLPAQPDMTVEFIVDTGFTGSLALPPATVRAMGLRYLYPTWANVADGRAVEVGVHTATIAWENAARDVHVLATGRRPLLGTALLDGHELVAQFREGGLVTVAALP